MWIMTTDGFYSAVQKTGESTLTIRARNREDLELLRAKFDLPDITDNQGTDYPYRIPGVTHEEWATILARLALEIDYSNFKNAVTIRRGKLHHDVYMRIWTALLSLEDAAARRMWHGWGDTTGTATPLKRGNPRKAKKAKAKPKPRTTK